MAKKRNNATKRSQEASRSKAKNRPTSNFFSKFYQRIICNSAYKSIISWDGNGLLLINDVHALEKAVHKQEVCSRRYDSIARQLRLYGFNRLTPKALCQRYAHVRELPTDCFAWQHESLSNSSTLQEIVAFERKARSRSKSPKKVEAKTTKKASQSLNEIAHELTCSSDIVSRVPMPLQPLTAISLEIADDKQLHDILAQVLDTLEPKQTHHIDDVGQQGQINLAHLQDADCNLIWSPELTTPLIATSSEITEAAPLLKSANDSLRNIKDDELGELHKSMYSSTSSIETDSNESESSFEELFEAIQDVARSDSTKSATAYEEHNSHDEPHSTFKPFSFDFSAESATVRFWATLGADTKKERR